MVHLGLSSSLSSYSSAAVAVAVAATMIAAAVANIKFIEVSKRKLRHLFVINKKAINFLFYSKLKILLYLSIDKSS